MERLRKWLDAMPGGRAKLAQALGIQRSLVSSWVNGARPIPMLLAIAIEGASRRAVLAEDLRTDVPWSILRAPPKRRRLQVGEYCVRVETTSPQRGPRPHARRRAVMERRAAP